MVIEQTKVYREVELIQVIRTSLTKRGKGVDGDVVRRVVQYWDLDGDLLAEVDPCPNGS